MGISIRHNKHTAARTASRLRRQVRGRKKIEGSAERPRLVVTRSSKHISVQLVDDLVGRTLVSASTMEADLRSLAADKTAKALKVGEIVADRAKAAGVETVVPVGKDGRLTFPVTEYECMPVLDAKPPVIDDLKKGPGSVNARTVRLRLLSVSAPGSGRAGRDNTAISDVSLVGSPA